MMPEGGVSVFNFSSEEKVRIMVLKSEFWEKSQNCEKLVIVWVWLGFGKNKY